MDRPKDAAQSVAIVGCVFQCDKIAVELIKPLVTFDKKLFDHVVKVVHGNAPLMSVLSLSLGNSVSTVQTACFDQPVTKCASPLMLASAILRRNSRLRSYA